MTLLISIAIAAGTMLVASPAPVATPIEAAGPLGSLKGTMLSPVSARRQVMLIIPGSGPTDRDGNNSVRVKAATYKLLAEGLAAQGIATVRIDKRGMFGSAGAVKDGNAVRSPIVATMCAAGSARFARAPVHPAYGCWVIVRERLWR